MLSRICIRKLMVLLFLAYVFALNFVFTQNKVDASTSKKHSIYLTGLQWLKKIKSKMVHWAHYPAITAS